MKETVNPINVLKYAGAFVACAIGSGFATGQEIMQEADAHLSAKGACYKGCYDETDEVAEAGTQYVADTTACCEDGYPHKS